MPLRAVFFDLDGTLLDTAPDLAKALNHLLRAKGKDAVHYDEIRRVVSDGAYALLKLGFGVERDHPDTEQLRQELLDYYLKDLSSETHPFPGITELIEKINENDLRWGIVTNKPWAYTEPLMKRFEFAETSSCIICPDHVSERKPAPESLLLACDQANCQASDSIYVGDHRRDIECGQRADMPTIAVGYGYISPQDDYRHWGADHIVESGHELWSVVAQYL